MNSTMPVRILHVLGGMNRGGVETWLLHVLRHIDRKRFRMDFLVHTAQRCAYDDDLRALGSCIVSCPAPSRPWRYAAQFRKILGHYGPYDAVHSHVHHYSGFVLRTARAAGVPLRIAHSHNDTSAAEAGGGWLRRGYLRLCQRWIRRCATTCLACSPRAAASLFGFDWRRDARVRVLSYGVDFTAFREAPDRAAVRAELGIPPGAFVLGHVGRFVEQKNHVFVVAVAAELVRRRADARLLLLGEGPLRPAIERQAQRLGLAGNTVFAGVRGDVPRLMRGAMDAFLFPSLFEGLGLVVVEAQAAGLPCFLSQGVPEDADVVVPLVHRLSLADSAARWADAILERCGREPPVAQTTALAALERSALNIGNCVEQLESVYAGSTTRLQAA